MKLYPIASNMTEIVLNDDLVVLFSYKTPVACFKRTREGREFYRTSKKWSVTTSKHINKWMDINCPGTPKPTWKEQPQGFFDNLIS